MKVIGLLLLLCLFCSCEQKTIPNGIIEPKEMCGLVEEITLIETHYQSKFGVPTQYAEALQNSVDLILHKYKTTRKIFEKSLKYYASHPDLQKKLNDQLLISLSRKIP